VTHAIARELGIRGLINIQFVIHQGALYILEANPRASRTVPIISKATGINLVAAATRIALGEKLRDMPWGTGHRPRPAYTVVKVPVFSFAKMRGVETILGPEMKSTGEVLGIDETYAGALLKGFLGAGIRLPSEGGRSPMRRSPRRSKCCASSSNWASRSLRRGARTISCCATASLPKRSIPSPRVRRTSSTRSPNAPSIS
jgi:hypothetical protein